MKKLYPPENLSIQGFYSNKHDKPEIIMKHIMGLGYSDRFFGTESSSTLNDLCFKLQLQIKQSADLQTSPSTTFRS